MSQESLKVINKPDYVIKGNKNESVMVPIEFKNVGKCQIPQGSYIGLTNRIIQLTNFIVDDVPLNSQIKSGETLHANVCIRYLKPTSENLTEKLSLCVFGPNG